MVTYILCTVFGFALCIEIII